MSKDRVRSALDSPLLRHVDVDVDDSDVCAKQQPDQGEGELGVEKRGTNWVQTTCALLALQLGWGLWLLPSMFAALGWLPGFGCLLCLALLTCYSGYLYCRLYVSTPGAVVFGDVGFKAAGHLGRCAVYATVYTLNGTRTVILHLAAAQSLGHSLPGGSRLPLWQCGALVLLLAGALVQVRSLAKLTWVFTAGTVAQLLAVIIVLQELLTHPDPEASYTLQAVSWGNAVPSLKAVMGMVFAFGGQSAFTEIMGSMRRAEDFPRSIGACTAVMALFYGAVGAVGYWSRGDGLQSIILFELGDTVLLRAASACLFFQATSQYVINLNVWTHQLLVLLARAGSGEPKQGKAEAGAGVACAAAAAGPRSARDHAPLAWLLASSFVVAYSFAISTTVPFFGSLVSLVTSATYLLCAYALPAWFTLRIVGGRLGAAERAALCCLIPAAVAWSLFGLWASLLSLRGDLQAGAKPGGLAASLQLVP